MKPGIEELNRMLQRERDRHYGMASVGIVAIVLVVLWGSGAFGADKPKIDPAVAAAWAWSQPEPSGVVVHAAPVVAAVPFRPATVAPSVVGVSTASAATARTGGIITLAPRGIRGSTNCTVG